MFRVYPFRKKIATVLLVLTVFQVTSPSVLVIAGSGPTSPEFFSFEPVDATDMVNPSTGSFTYNLPILTVPGPNGGFPISLSYHSGIEPNQDPSWVGLGWSLNPGAVNRIVNGYPDDQHSVTRTVHENMESEVTTQYGIGLSYGSFYGGLNFVDDSYKGLKVGGSLGVGVPIKTGGQVVGNIGLNVGVSPYGQVSVGVNSGVGGAGSGSIGIGISSDFQSMRVTSTAADPTRLLGASISSDGSFSSSVAGMSSYQSNNNIGKLKSNSEGFNLPIPLGSSGAMLNLGYSTTRYWSSEIGVLSTYGSLFYDKATASANRHVTSLDSYALPFNSNTNETTAFKVPEDPDKALGGSMLDYDAYNVLAQGVGGSIKPYTFDVPTLFRQDITRVIKFGDYQTNLPIINYLRNGSPELYPSNHKMGFRFIHEPTNNLTYTGGTYPTQINKNDLVFNGGSAPIATSSKPEGFNNNTLVGARHIETYTNQEIQLGLAKSAGLINHEDHGARSTIKIVPEREVLWLQTQNAQYDVSSQIGAYKITNESGVTYHFTLPVYAYGEVMRSVKDKSKAAIPFFWEVPSINDTYRVDYRKHPYAYTWLLTAITGPDFVDVDQNGKISDDDKGYWVQFDYGRWTDRATWRSPDNAPYHIDRYTDFARVSGGHKEIYYLNYIRTATHTALFVKDIREDSKFNSDFNFIEFGQKPTNYVGCTNAYLPIAPMKLDKIILFTNTELDGQLFTKGGIRSLASLKNTYQVTPLGTCTTAVDPPYHFGNNVIDVHDVHALDGNNKPNLDINKALTVHELVTDYSLCKSDKNINNTVYQNYANAGFQDRPYVSTYFNPITGVTETIGKLTLKRINFIGANGKKLAPPIEFGYGFNPDYQEYKEDYWGFYKSDHDGNIYDLNKTVTSATDASAWSLTEINTSIGASIKIEYEANRYNKVEMLANQITHRISSISNNNRTLHFYPNNLDVLPEVGQEIDVVFSHDIEGVHSQNRGLFKYIVSAIDPINKTVTLDDAFISNHNFRAITFNPINPYTRLGGGIRVKAMHIESDEKVLTTHYEYSNGVTSYEPFLPNEYGPSIFKTDRQFFFDKYFFNVLALNRFAPAPGVMYGKVGVYQSVKDKILNTVSVSLGYDEYTFDVFKMSKHLKISQSQPVPIDGIYNLANTVKIVNNTASIGQLLNHKHYTAKQGVVLSEVQNTYLDESTNSIEHYANTLNDKFGDQGHVSQTFKEGKLFTHDYQYQTPANWLLNGRFNYTTIEEYPSFLIQSTQMDYKKGIGSETKTLSLDYYTGTVTSSISKVGSKKAILTETVPAYTKIPAMGPKGLNSDSKNMLSQEAESYSYVLQSINPLVKAGVLSANVGVWSNQVETVNGLQPQIWRNTGEYAWRSKQALNTDGTMSLNALQSDPFVYSPSNHAQEPGLTLSPSSDWLKTSKINTLDKMGQVIETLSLNNQKGVSISSEDGLYVLATASNCGLKEFAYSGAEGINPQTTMEGGVQKMDGQSSAAQTHTGKQSLLTAPGKISFSFTIPRSSIKSPHYSASVWVYLPGDAQQYELDNAKLVAKIGNTQVAVATPSITEKAGSWYLLNVAVDAGSTGDLTFYCQNSATSRSIYFDDFRVAPTHSSMSSYVYDKSTFKLTHILNHNNLYTRYEYDQAGTLVAQYQELIGAPTQDVITTKQTYNYGNQR